MLKQTVNKTYVEIKEKGNRDQIKSMVYSSNKAYNRLQRNLLKPKNRLYDFEDYLNTSYGNPYSIGEFNLAMKPHKVALNKAYKHNDKDPEFKRSHKSAKGGGERD